MSECDQIVDSLPKHEFTYALSKGQPNAYVFIDTEGSICILPVDGGVIWAAREDFNGDVAPWCD